MEDLSVYEAKLRAEWYNASIIPNNDEAIKLLVIKYVKLYKVTYLYGWNTYYNCWHKVQLREKPIPEYLAYLEPLRKISKMGKLFHYISINKCGSNRTSHRWLYMGMIGGE